jgi:hypothetical protein
MLIRLYTNLFQIVFINAWEVTFISDNIGEFISLRHPGMLHLYSCYCSSGNPQLSLQYL